MGSPKHLWSGDWEAESAHAAEQRAAQPAPQPDLPQAQAAAALPLWRRFTVAQIAVLVGALVIVAVAFAIAGGSGSPAKQPTAPSHANTNTAPPNANTGGAAIPQTTPSVVVTGPGGTWLGMQIVSTTNGAVIATVPYGTAGDAAGFEPGDVITQIDNDGVSSAKQIKAALANVPLGHQVQITVTRGSSIFTTVVTLKERPTIQP